MIKQDDELDKLEEDIRRVKNKYDQFFAGIQKVPPLQERRNIEIYIYELGKLKMRENARRFRYNQLLSRYNQYRELWGRKIREREEGPLDFRRRAAALSEPEPPRSRSRAAAAVTSPKADPYVKLAAGSNGEEMEKQSELVRSKYHVDVVGFRVDVVDGKVKLKAKPIQE